MPLLLLLVYCVWLDSCYETTFPSGARWHTLSSPAGVVISPRAPVRSTALPRLPSITLDVRLYVSADTPASSSAKLTLPLHQSCMGHGSTSTFHSYRLPLKLMPDSRSRGDPHCTVLSRVFYSHIVHSSMISVIIVDG